jgi:hypothetical protein
MLIHFTIWSRLICFQLYCILIPVTIIFTSWSRSVQIGSNFQIFTLAPDFSAFLQIGPDFSILHLHKICTNLGNNFYYVTVLSYQRNKNVRQTCYRYVGFVFMHYSGHANFFSCKHQYKTNIKVYSLTITIGFTGQRANNWLLEIKVIDYLDSSLQLNKAVAIRSNKLIKWLKMAITKYFGTLLMWSSFADVK